MLGWILIPLFGSIDYMTEKVGTFNSVQKFRESINDYHITHNGHLKSNLSAGLFENILKADLQLREATQREEDLKQRYQALKAMATDENKKQLDTWLK